MAFLLGEHFTKKIRPLLDTIDQLREVLGREEGISLPSLAVIGKQSAGKSTLLERLSGIQLPQGEGMVTRCPMVMRLRSSPQPRVRMGIDPHNLQETKEGETAKKIAEMTEQLMEEKADADEKTFGITKTPIHVSVLSTPVFAN